MISKMKNNKKVVLGLSGGVDSTAAALLLQEKGYEVIGLYLDVFGEESREGVRGRDYEENRAKNDKDSGAERARLAADELGIKFLYRDVRCLFEDIVIENFCGEYMNGRTPNPCIVCNPGVKFKALLEAADEEGAYYIATGHYAGTFYDEKDDMWYIKRAANEKKDQSYMLYSLGQEAISRLLLPLSGTEDKEQVREIARKNALYNAEARDSQEICFIERDDNYKDFLSRRGYIQKTGDFVDKHGKVLGKHKGILNYTIGQRKGLGIALGKPAFVTAIDSKNNRVMLGDSEELFRREVISSGNIIYGIDMSERMMMKDGETAASFGLIGADADCGITAKIRYAAKPARASIEMMENGRLLTTFEEPQRAATPGQSIVFYSGDLVIGGGFID